MARPITKCKKSGEALGAYQSQSERIQQTLLEKAGLRNRSNFLDQIWDMRKVKTFYYIG